MVFATIRVIQFLLEVTSMVFVALFINTIATLLAVILSLQPILGDEIVYGKIVPG